MTRVPLAAYYHVHDGSLLVVVNRHVHSANIVLEGPQLVGVPGLPDGLCLHRFIQRLERFLQPRFVCAPLPGLPAELAARLLFWWPHIRKW